MKLVRLARAAMTPRVLGLSFLGLIGVSALTATLLNVVTLRQLLTDQRAPVTGIPLAMAVAPTPRPLEYRNQITLSDSKRGTVTLPVHAGKVDHIGGPVAVRVAAGAEVLWTPAGAASGTPTIVWSLFMSSVDGVNVSGEGDEKARSLNPGAYFPETLALPIHIVNPTARAAVVTIVVGVNFEDGGGGDF